MEEKTIEQRAHDLVLPLWHNAYWVRNSLEQWQAINKHAKIINEGKHSHFWGLTQKTSLDHAVICLARMYDDNNQYKVHSVYEAIRFLEDYLSYELASCYSNRIGGIELDFLSNKKIAVLFRDRSKFSKDKTILINAIRASQPSRKAGSPLAKVMGYRSKFVAHQEIMTTQNIKKFSELPELDKLYELNDWANNISRLVLSVFIPNTYFSNEGPPSAFMATSNVIRKYLGITFNDPEKSDRENYQAHRDFYSKS